MLNRLFKNVPPRLEFVLPAIGQLYLHAFGGEISHKEHICRLAVATQKATNALRLVIVQPNCFAVHKRRLRVPHGHPFLYLGGAMFGCLALVLSCPIYPIVGVAE